MNVLSLGIYAEYVNLSLGSFTVAEYVTGDLLWSKLEGYPWWPSLVCNHPTDNTHYKKGKLPQIHVQFFDNPTSRAWIKVKYVYRPAIFVVQHIFLILNNPKM